MHMAYTKSNGIKGCGIDVSDLHKTQSFCMLYEILFAEWANYSMPEFLEAVGTEV